MPTIRPSESTSGPPEKPGVNRDIQAHELIHLPGTPRPPGTPNAAHESQARAYALFARAPQRQYQVPDFQTRRLAQFRRTGLAGIQFEDGQVSARVPSRQNGRDVPAIRQGDRNLLVALQRVLGGHHHIRLPKHSTRRNMLPPMNRHHRPASPLGGAC